MIVIDIGNDYKSEQRRQERVIKRAFREYCLHIGGKSQEGNSVTTLTDRFFCVFWLSLIIGLSALVVRTILFVSGATPTSVSRYRRLIAGVHTLHWFPARVTWTPIKYHQNRDPNKSYKLKFAPFKQLDVLPENSS